MCFISLHCVGYTEHYRSPSRFSFLWCFWVSCLGHFLSGCSGIDDIHMWLIPAYLCQVASLGLKHGNLAPKQVPLALPLLNEIAENTKCFCDFCFNLVIGFPPLMTETCPSRMCAFLLRFVSFWCSQSPPFIVSFLLQAPTCFTPSAWICEWQILSAFLCWDVWICPAFTGKNIAGCKIHDCRYVLDT